MQQRLIKMKYNGHPLHMNDHLFVKNKGLNNLQYLENVLTF